MQKPVPDKYCRAHFMDKNLRLLCKGRALEFVFSESSSGSGTWKNGWEKWQQLGALLILSKYWHFVSQIG